MIIDVTSDLLAAMIWVAIMLTLPTVGAALVVGVVVGLVQAITSIQEQTLSFVPKLLAVGLVLILFGGWMMRLLVVYTVDLFSRMPEYGTM